MKRFLKLVRFELTYYLRSMSPWIYFSIMAFMAFLMMVIFAGAFPDVTAAIEGTDGTVFVNSPHVLLILISMFGLFGTLVVAAVAGNAGYRDFAFNMHPLTFTTPTTKFEYVASRYIGTVVVNTLVMSGVAVGLWFGSIMPFVAAERIGPTMFGAYLRPYLVIVLPNILFASAIFLSMAMLTRKRMPHYIGGAGLLLGYMLSRAFLGQLEAKWIAAFTDPFGIGSIRLATEYWTPIEKNTMLLEFSGWVLINRAFWVGLAIAIVVFCVWRFKFSFSASEGSRRKKKDGLEPVAPQTSRLPVDVPAVRQVFGVRAVFPQFRTMTRRAFGEVIASPFFVAILAGAVLFLVLNAMQLETVFGTRTWPMAWKVIEVLGGSFSLFVVILIVLYSGELVWRERDLKLDQVVDATPTPSWIGFVSKLTALLGMVVLLLVAVTLAGMLTQSLLGFFRFEPLLYAQKLMGMQFLDYTLLCVMALSIHTIVNHKYTGHFILVLFFVGVDLLPLMGFEHSMLQYGSDLGTTYSDMNSHGWYLGPFLWFKLYWGGVAVLMAVMSNLLWPRGVDGRVRQRFHSAKLRIRAATMAVAVIGGVLALGAGGFVYYNTNVRNTYRSSGETSEMRAQFEKDYKQYDGLAQPRIVAVVLEVDLFPESGDVLTRGTQQLVNKTDEPIERIHVGLIEGVIVKRFEFDVPATLEHDDPLGYFIYALDPPLEPGATITAHFDLEYRRKGFSHNIQNSVVKNGTFVNSSILPSYGYDSGQELVLDRARKKYDLEPKERMLDLDDPEGRLNNYISRDADWVDFEVVVSTVPDQIALSPGYLQREWEENGRRYFHYKMDAPILNFFSFLSADYVVERDQWNDVAIEVYYHPGHEFNVAGMIESVKKSLEYFSREFSPYQHRQLRILEFPRYASFAQSFPNTIPYSESIGFIARIKDEDIDYPFYVTAHEVAHQWWAHQVIGGNLQGSTVLSETLSQYSALMVMEREYGKDKIRRFLEYELDMYLRGRSAERKKEVPLLRAENQGYIHYRKGSVIMYGLRDVIGEEAVNRALRNFVSEWGFQGPPYPTSRDLYQALQAETPEDLLPWLADLFEHITLYENRALTATSTPTDDGRFEVTIAF
ncbi:M1 family aminopeptidase, partial [bacterium]|nr:M1 family aminopeptidase [bacterium]